jgi:hypothetical protein
MAKFLFLSSTIDVPGQIASPPSAHVITCIDQYDLDGVPDQELAAVDGLVISMHADQHHLQRHAARLDAFVERRGMLVNGHVMHPFLPELVGPFVPLPTRDLAHLRVSILPSAALFEGIADDDLTYRHGVAGFWSRGSQTPPAGAEVLTTLGPSVVPCDWTIARQGGGRLLLHPGNDIWTFCEAGTRTDRLWTRVLDWLGGGRDG